MDNRNINTSLLFQPHPLPSLQTIVLKGELLGEGKNGKAYLLNDKVYKIFHEPSSSNAYDPAKRSAKYWNQLYSKIYSGKYAIFATAFSQIMKIGDYEYNVLITPYIDDKGNHFSKNKHLPTIEEEFKKLGVMMIDQDVPGNIKMYGEDPLPIDLDLIIPAPIKSKNCCCFSFFTFPLSASPIAKRFIEKEYGSSVTYEDENTPLLNKNAIQ